MAVLYIRNDDGTFVEVPALQGRSAYAIAVANGFDGTEEEWLKSLKPQRGIDYWTEEDKAEIIAAVIAQLPNYGGGDSPSGGGATSYTNMVPLSTDANGDIYNNGLGYKDGYAMSSSNTEVEAGGFTITGFIPVKKGCTIRLAGSAFADYTEYSWRFVAYDANYNYLHTRDGQGWANTGTIVQEDTTSVTWIPNEYTISDQVKYCRISCRTGANTASVNGKDLIITVEEPLDGSGGSSSGSDSSSGSGGGSSSSGDSSGEYYTTIQVEGADYYTTPESTSGASPVLTITVGRYSDTNKLYFFAKYGNTQLCVYPATSTAIVAFKLGSSYYYDGDSFTIGGETGQDTVVNITEINGF